MRNLDAIRKRIGKLEARSRPVSPIVLIDATVFVDDQTFLEFAAADEDVRARMRADLAGYEAALVAERTADLPVVEGSQAITAIIVTAKLPEEHDLWRLTAEADAPSPEKQASLERRDAMIAEAGAESRREQAMKLLWAERDHDPSGPDGEILYFEVPSGWPVTRAMHRARLEGFGG